MSLINKLSDEGKDYQFMDCKDLRTTQFIYLSHTCAIILQCCNKCTGNINNIYRLYSAIILCHKSERYQETSISMPNG